MKSRKGIGGRPRDGRNAKTAPIGIRADPELKARIQQYQQAQGLPSFSLAVERLLKRGLERGAA